MLPDKLLKSACTCGHSKQSQSTQTNSVPVVKISKPPNKCARPPLPRDIDQSDKSSTTVFEFCEIIHDPESSKDFTLIKETVSVEVKPHLYDSEDDPSTTSSKEANRYKYCKEVIKPYLKLSGDCPGSEEELLRSVLNSVSEDFPDYQPCFEIFQGEKEISDNINSSGKTSISHVDGSSACLSAMEDQKENKKSKCIPISKSTENVTAPHCPKPAEESKEKVRECSPKPKCTKKKSVEGSKKKCAFESSSVKSEKEPSIGVTCENKPPTESCTDRCVKEPAIGIRSQTPPPEIGAACKNKSTPESCTDRCVKEPAIGIRSQTPTPEIGAACKNKSTPESCTDRCVKEPAIGIRSQTPTTEIGAACKKKSTPESCTNHCVKDPSIETRSQTPPPKIEATCENKSTPESCTDRCAKEPAIRVKSQNPSYFLTERCRDSDSLPNTTESEESFISKKNHQKTISTIKIAMEDFVCNVYNTTKDAVSLISIDCNKKVDKADTGDTQKCEETKGLTFNFFRRVDSLDKDDKGSDSSPELKKISDVIGNIKSKLSMLSDNISLSSISEGLKPSKFNDTSSPYDNPTPPKDVTNILPSTLAPASNSVFATIKEKIISFFCEEQIKPTLSLSRTSTIKSSSSETSSTEKSDESNKSDEHSQGDE
ncbi:Uncharacterized protein OBRU01_26063 [Operophtera brumata]|uniref:Uncharacterized protein n=1 Tax=Operophtera brumata TaxID=104452 RepID=A0A0L7K3E8_OPEBR|nr:Uncharacterized protein OBRU01_26063 [Operophtera brumata]